MQAPGGDYPLALRPDDAGVEVEMQQELQHLRPVDDSELPVVTSLLGQVQLELTRPVVVAGTGLRHLLVRCAVWTISRCCLLTRR